MGKRPFSKEPNYLQAIRGLHRLHSLTVAGKDQTAEADEVRDELDQSWNRLSEAERKRLEGLSEDLYSLSDPEQRVEPLNSTASRNLAAVLEAKKSSEWDMALSRLRVWSRFLDMSLLSYMRGSIWQAAGDIATATLFYRHAYERDTNNGNYASLYLLSLEKSDPCSGMNFAKQIVYADESYPPSLVINAAGIFFYSTIGRLDDDGISIINHLVTILVRNIDRLENSEGANDSVYVTAIGHLGLCYDRLGDYGKALRCYDEALKRRPDLDALYLSRGILRYGRDARAFEDFKEAIRLNPGSFWPYVYLAHSALLEGSFEKCLDFCMEGLNREEEFSSITTELHEWSAICMAELHYPVDRIVSEFEVAVRLSPESVSAKQNLFLFTSDRNESHADWSKPTKSKLRTFGTNGALRPLIAA